MQAVIAIPGLETLARFEGGPRFLLREVAGVPLLIRAMATAIRAGADSLLVVWPEELDSSVWRECAESPLVRRLKIRAIALPSPFDPREEPDWRTIASDLDDRFLWLPWNWVTNKYALAATSLSEIPPARWNKPVLIAKDVAIRSPRVVLHWNAKGVSVTSTKRVSDAERFLVANSGKPTDGMYSKFNRLLCRGAVRLLAHTGVTPNFITLAGLVLAVVSASYYARGTYASYVVGAILFFLCGLFDDMDGMLARLKFRESAFGTWFEGFVDNATYLLLFGGITVGLYHQRGSRELLWGIALITGCVLSVVVVALSRKRGTAADRPHEWAGRMDTLLKKDSTLISRSARQLSLFIRKGVAIHYILLFTVLGGLPLFLRLAALGANLTWTLGLYFTDKFFRKSKIETAVEDLPTAA
jgi:phosphatidylglycerophosphate synthase